MPDWLPFDSAFTPPAAYDELNGPGFGDPSALTSVVVFAVLPLGGRFFAVRSDGNDAPVWQLSLAAPVMKPPHLGLVAGAKGSAPVLRLQFQAPGGGCWLRVDGPAGWGSSEVQVVAGSGTIDVPLVNGFSPQATGVFDISWSVRSRHPTESRWNLVASLPCTVYVVPSAPLAPWSLGTGGGEALTVSETTPDIAFLSFATRAVAAATGGVSPIMAIALAMTGPTTSAAAMQFGHFKWLGTVDKENWSPFGVLCRPAKPLTANSLWFGPPLLEPVPAQLILSKSRALIRAWLGEGGPMLPLSCHSIDFAILLASLCAIVGQPLILRTWQASPAVVAVSAWDTVPPKDLYIGPKCDYLLRVRSVLPRGASLWTESLAAQACDPPEGKAWRWHTVAVAPEKDFVFDTSIAALRISPGTAAEQIAAPLELAASSFLAALLLPVSSSQLIHTSDMVIWGLSET